MLARRTYIPASNIRRRYIPAQASSVRSECIFSSSKETCTLRRSNLSPASTTSPEVYFDLIYKQDRLNFIKDLVADERDYTISGPVTPRGVDELLQNAIDIDYH
ncbi:hypothetical protein BDR05DRAFT_689916 [Suillus weaverae]|nr:hypothetical protein BDR05DRAFT_689916 [Suillus weaverae]